MRGRSWLAVVCVVAVAAGGALIANAVVAANAAPVPASCPATQPGDPGYSGLLTSELRLVPFTPEHALVCRYNGMNSSGDAAAWALAGSVKLDRARAVGLAASINAAAHLPELGEVNCPDDDASHTDAYFWDSSHRIRVRLRTSGCETASNGGLISPSISQSDIGPIAERLTSGKGTGTIRGTILQFGGPMTAGGAQPTPRPIAGIVAVYRHRAGQSTVAGAPIAQLRTAVHGTFSFTLESGRYFVVADSLEGTQIVQPQPVTLAAGGTPNLVLGVNVP
jgi:hypothetical protein